MSNLNRLLRLVAARAAFGFAFAACAAAQTSPASSSAPAEATVVLSPFEVSAQSDDGYQTANAIGATRTNTPLIELPQSI